jgi:2-polyprenyl-3-methyl-5-hydroxy-6-metoxy-1,4-benzoquinol methylase
MTIEKRDFDKEAASWDEQPSRVKLANDVAGVITKQITLTSDMDVLDFGCGTGLLTLQLQPQVRSITGADSSEGMLAVFRKKIADRNLTNAKALLLDLDKDDRLTGNYHLIVSNMTLHHIEDIQHLLDQFHKVTVPGGYLCITDLEPDNGLFHDDNTGVFHFGFDRMGLRKAFMDAGFDNVKDTTAAEIVKPAPDGEMRRFTVFLMCGQKR